jgi:ABC-type spermidine/putrescine transport system permease subunit I
MKIRLLRSEALRNRLDLMALLPISGWEVFFYLIPLLFLLIISFWTSKDYDLIPTWSLSNYQEVFSNPLFRKAFLWSVWITIATLLITISVAYPFAYGLAFVVPKNYRQVILIAIVAPFWTNYLVRVYSWQLIIGGNGIISQSLIALGLIDTPLQILYTHVATSIGLLHFLITVMILNLYSTLDNIDRSLIEAASDLGAGPFRCFFWIIFPLSVPGLAIGTMFGFIFAFTDFIAPSVLGGGTKPVFSQMIVDAAHWNANYPMASALSAVMLLAISAFLLLLFRIVKGIIKG